MILSFRLRRFFQWLFVTAFMLVLTAAVLLLCWFLWLNRYVVYTKDGAKLLSMTPQEITVLKF